MTLSLLWNPEQRRSLSENPYSIVGRLRDYVVALSVLRHSESVVVTMKINIAELAMSKVDLDKPETMKGIGVSLASVAPIILIAEDLFEKVERAKERGQRVEPTAVRLSIQLLKAAAREFGATWNHTRSGGMK